MTAECRRERVEQEPVGESRRTVGDAGRNDEAVALLDFARRLPYRDPQASGEHEGYLNMRVTVGTVTSPAAIPASTLPAAFIARRG